MARTKREPPPKWETSAGVQLRLWRVHTGLKQSELETRAGLAHNAVSRIETGEVSPRIETLERLAGALEISIEELQFRTPPPSKKKERSSLWADELFERLDQLPQGVRQSLLEIIHSLIDLYGKSK